MGSIGSLLGTAGGAMGTGFSGPTSAGVTNPTDVAQINTAYQGVQNSQQQQQDLLTALQGQNGIQNQSQVYNQMQGVVNGTGPNPAQAQLAQATGANVANQAALMAGQRGSNANAGLIARQAAQQGAATQQNSAGQASSLQATQSLNALNSSGSMAGSQVANQIGQTNANTAAQQAEQAALFNAQAGVNTANVGMQSNINNVNGQLANTQLQGQQAMIGGLMSSASGMGGMIGGLMSSASGMGGMMGGAQGGQVSEQGFKRYDDGGEVDSDSVPAVNVPDAPSDAPVQSEAAPGADFGDFGKESTAVNSSINASTPSFGSDAGAAALGQGASGGKGGGGGGGGLSSIMGLVAMMADGGAVDNTTSANTSTGPQPKSKFGQFMKGMSSKPKDSGSPEATPNYGNPGANALYQGAASLGKSMTSGNGGASPGMSMTGGSGDNSGSIANTPMMAAKGGKVPALVSPGEQYLKPKDVKKVVAEGKNPLAVGERIPGKPKFPGNNYANDVVPKKLDTGGIIIPNEVMQSKNPHWEAMRFVHATLAKNGKSLPKKSK